MQMYSAPDIGEFKLRDDRFGGALINNEDFSVAFNIIEPGTVIPFHQHDEETIDIVLDGIMKMTIGGQTLVVTKNAVAKVGSNIPHGATAITRCKVINISYSVRKLPGEAPE